MEKHDTAGRIQMLKKMWTWISRGIGKRPVPEKGTYLKYGFVVTRYEKYLCPECRNVLDAGPNYQPRYCDQCGQKINFKGIAWKSEEILGFTERKEGRS